MEFKQDYIEEIEKILKEDSRAYFESFSMPPFRGISINRLKADPEKLLPLLNFETKKSPFYKDGYYIPADVSGIGSSPLHHAGAFYVQEPSASSAVELLDVKKGDYVLDLCAAPGGKSAQIASILGKTGLIWSNEPVKSRANILLSNHERMGIRNCVVSFGFPDDLCPKIEGAFDKVLVDAPCSGEGMFRKNPDAALQWSREHVVSCANRQLAILLSAVMALRPGGTLVYSTCTFSEEENEMTVKRFLESCPEMEACDIERSFGRETELQNAVRITPLEGGEGHFAAKFRKKGDQPRSPFRQPSQMKPDKNKMKIAEKFLDDIFVKRPDMETVITGNSIYLRPAGIQLPERLPVMRFGVYAGDIVKDRVEPAHSLFVTGKPSEFRRVMNLRLDDPRTMQFLSGMETECDGENGYTAVAVEGMAVGFGKCSGGRLKNKYPKGLRER